MTVLVPTAAAEVAVNVAVLVVLVEAALNEAVTPAGKPEAVSATALVKPVLGVTVMVLVPAAPCATLNVEVEAVSEKAAGGATVKVTGTVELSEPDLPVTVTVAAPVAALALAVKVNVLVLPVLAGLNDAVTPAGSPEAVRATAPVNPFLGETEIEAVAVAL